MTQGKGPNKSAFIRRFREFRVENPRSLLSYTLKSIPPELIVSFLKDESPPTWSVVLAHLEPDRGAKLIKLIPDALQIQVIHGLAKLGEISDEAIEELCDELSQKARDIQNNINYKNPGGLQKVADILSQLDTNKRTEMLSQIKSMNESLFVRVEEKMIQFADIGRLQEKDLRQLYLAVTPSLWLKALRKSPPTIMDSIKKAISERSFQNLISDLANQPPIRLSDIENSQNEIAMILRQKIQANEISFPDPTDPLI